MPGVTLGAGVQVGVGCGPVGSSWVNHVPAALRLRVRSVLHVGSDHRLSETPPLPSRYQSASNPTFLLGPLWLPDPVDCCSPGGNLALSS